MVVFIVTDTKQRNSYENTIAKNYTQRFASEQECIQAGNRLLITDSRYRYFCTDVKNK